MIKYLVIFLTSIFLVFNQVFLLDLFPVSIKVILLLICYLMIKNVKRGTRQLFLFFIFFCFEILTTDYPGYLTLIVLILEICFDYLKSIFKINFFNLIEYFSYFVIYFYFSGNIFSSSFFINLFFSILMIIFFYIRTYGFTKVFRN
jgi:hypothetical protein